jgi:hypothetical protein
MIRQSAVRAAVLIAFGGVVAGCSETGFQDFIGAGKYAPDETQVAVNQPLSVPPDLQLRPPSDEPQRVASAPPPSQQPASGDLQQPQDLGLSPQDEPAAPPAQVQPQPSRSRNSRQMPASRRTSMPAGGCRAITRTAREKSQLELNEEMRRKRDEVKRQEDPNYGTIWNLGSIWSDG